MRLFLSGPMGSGKSTVARAVAARLGASAIDLDGLIESRVGSTVSAIFASEGEAAFRRIERETALELAGDPLVVALGGGTVTDSETRRALLRRGVLVTLTAGVDELVRRVGEASTRPLLAGRDVPAVLREIVRARAGAYAECHAVVSTEGRPIDAIVDDVLRVAADVPVVVALGERSYRVEIGGGVRSRLGERARAAASGDAVLVHDDATRPWPKDARAALESAGARVIEVALPAGEGAKTVATVERIWDGALEGGADRRAIVVGVGGGVIGDLAAFAASTLLRGVALGQLPTTLLAMVDSSVGGKTGFNRAAGKNLVGTFYQPSFVLCDVETLSTLPAAERVSGLAEVVKSAWLDGEDAVASLERDADALLRGDPDATIRAVRMSVGLKARIVAADETESGERMLLNLGHTLGHAIEAANGYRGRHGEAVALGMVAALRVGVRMGRLSPAQASRAQALIGRLGLPTDVAPHLDERTLAFLGSDKKRRGGTVHFVVPGPPGACGVEPLTLDALRDALRAG